LEDAILIVDESRGCGRGIVIGAIRSPAPDERCIAEEGISTDGEICRRIGADGIAESTREHIIKDYASSANVR